LPAGATAFPHNACKRPVLPWQDKGRRADADHFRDQLARFQEKCETAGASALRRGVHTELHEIKEIERLPSP
ncbi:MAG: hypothetical protein AB1440_04085, partial [Pseudomonadota bacterium]